ncbi:MAG: FAD binding domain-containing protein [Anaerolineae bacterium]|nr:FAD binding domain-containing protein [Anaerolineae bacterium]
MWQTYYTPASIDEALRLLSEYGPEARIIAGGTDLLIELRRGDRKVCALIDITRIEGLDRLWVEDGLVHLGPALTHNQALASRTLLRDGFPLALACWQLGFPQLRNRATLVGNMVTASPANDTIAALVALDGRLTLRSLRGERVLSCAEFYEGVRRTALAADEMVTEVAFPALTPNQRGLFMKLALRRAHAIALVNLAVVLTFEQQNHREIVAEARIALGSVAPTVIRAREAEAALQGTALSEAEISSAADLAARAAAPIDDLRAGADYRRQMVRVLVQRALSTLRQGTERAAFPARPPLLWGRSDGRYPPVTGDTLSHTSAGDEPVALVVNGEQVVVRGAGGKTLLQMLREDLGLTGTKDGCAEGECGACTVWMDGLTVLSCLVPAPRAHGTHIVTIEGLAREGHLHPVQQAFIDEGAVQCGYCTPGFVMAGASLLDEIPRPSQEQIVAALTGNLCRCTGYYKIVRAIERAAAHREA